MVRVGKGDSEENSKCRYRESKIRRMAAAQWAHKVVGQLNGSTHRKRKNNGPQLPDL